MIFLDFMVVGGFLFYNKTKEDNELLREVLLHIPFQTVK
jgi:hypothetical protein